MAGKSTEQLEYECANLLKEFGFSEYEAYTLALLKSSESEIFCPGRGQYSLRTSRYGVQKTQITD